MGRSQGTRRARVLASVLCLGALPSGCHVAEAKVWNLEQVHELDGTPKRRGRLRSDLAFVVYGFLEQTNFGGADFQQQEEKKIPDPLGECLENLVELADCKDDRKVVFLKALAYSWLAVDCTYALSRERCALELGALAGKLGVQGPLDLGPDARPATPDEVAAAYAELVTAARECLRADAGASELRDACEAIRALVLERQGALRLLRAANVLLREDRGQESLAPLRELRLEFARRAVGLALQGALADRDGRVRAAGLEACMRVAAGKRSDLLRQALLEPLEDVEQREELALRALALVARHGLPPSEGADPAALERDWTELLMRVLRGELDWFRTLDETAEGRTKLAACRALARVTGRPASPRAEVWIAWWSERVASEASPGAADREP